MSSFIEKEVSYSINLSQDLLYIILSSYISKKCFLSEKYVDFVDENDVRIRLRQNSFDSTLKTVQSFQKIVHAYGNALVPLVQRISVEQSVHRDQVSPRLKRILTCRVYRVPDRPEIEIKFEQVYLERNMGDNFDSLMASKQIALLNLLQRDKRESVTKNSHLGSDEILAYIRVEYEYVGETPDPIVLDRLAALVADMDAVSHCQNIGPLLPYTTLKNNIIYRKFQEEKLLRELNYDAAIAAGGFKWALKLDGIRGKGLFTRDSIIMFMDDMRMYSGSLPWLFSVNNAVAFQCELVGDTVTYITDLLHVFKYTYNNKTQYECSLDGYDINAVAAVECLSRMHAKNPEGVKLTDWHTGETMLVKFQVFMDPPLRTDGYSTIPTDGFVVLDAAERYIKYKYNKTVELEYDADEKVFKSLNGPLTNYTVVTSDGVALYHEKIYETVIDCETKTVTVIKLRPDRLVPQVIGNGDEVVVVKPTK
ncbi:late expression factor 4 [Orgyia leucostigma nucleopolyhedrovirus]|uniref:Late expression factor 4 n=1 Tax=Orgyia leucostigma nucleopolyhedrovirus TaxID=490711 RepID=B0FDU6_9ABAC|nr:late expression factor 4 [Orgyia leucostigma nucleopolyhedrovirus]ABY65804.1 late expression factor 4 [Orgyia leucostigma nucleopolyhedrovirus]